MTTYSFDGMVLHEYYDIVETSPGNYNWVEAGGAVYQQPYVFTTSLDSDSFSYTVDATLATELDVSLTGLGMPYNLALPSMATEQNVALFATLLDADFDYSNVLTVSWDELGTAKSATILTVGWEWEDFNEMTADSLTMVINLTGDDFPDFADYAAFQAFIATSTMTPTAPAGYQAGDDIALADVGDYIDKTQDDLIQGVDANDDLRGGIGNDVIIGAQGNDAIYGSFGFDTLYGGMGSDSINGGNRADLIFGGDGDDVLRGGNGHDTIHGGDGADTAYMGTGNDVFYDTAETGPAGNDTVWGGTGNDTFYGSGGDDLFIGMAGNDTLLGGTGDDILRAGADNDRLFGGQGSDDLFAGSGSDTLTGGAGDDIFIFTSIDASDANVIRDFQLGIDEIEIENYDANTTTFQVVANDTLVTLESGATILVEGVTDATALESDVLIF